MICPQQMLQRAIPPLGGRLKVGGLDGRDSRERLALGGGDVGGGDNGAHLVLLVTVNWIEF